MAIEYGKKVDPLPVMDLSGRMSPFCTIEFAGETYALGIGFAEMADYWDVTVSTGGTVITRAQARVGDMETEQDWHAEVERVIGRLQARLDQVVNLPGLEDPDFVPGNRTQELVTSHDDLINRLVLAVQDGKLIVVDREPEG